MSLLKNILNLLPAKTVYAHCDIPCGIYDPNRAQQAAHTVMRMTTMINDLQATSDNAPFEERKKIIHQITRLTEVKEEHAEILKHEVQVIWSDYFKPEHLEKFPDLHEKVWKLLKLASKTKQEINADATKELLEVTLKFAEIFYQSKGLEPVRIKSPYPTEGEIIIYK
jgi:nickel superoxide dismutase